MSNVEPDQPGVIDAALLARLVPIWSVMNPQQLAGSTGDQAGQLSRDQARDEIRKRLEDLYPLDEPGFLQGFAEFWGNLRGDISGRFREFEDVNIRQQQERSLDAAAELIADAIPEDARTPGVITQVNLPAFVNAIAANPDAALQLPDGSQIPNVVLSSMARVQQTVAGATGTTQPQTPPGVAIDPVTGNPTLQIPGAEAAQAGLTAQQIRVATRYGSIPFDGQPLRVDLTGVVQPVRAGRVPGPEFAGFAQDPMTGAQRPMSTSTTLMPPGVTGSSGVVSVTQAADYLYSLAPQEVEQLQERLRAAGYFTQMGFDQNTGIQSMIEVPFERGYSDDQATSDAWIAVITDALREQRSVDELLRNRSMDFERRRQNIVESTTQQRTQQFAGSLRNVREMADEFAIETLGRRLTVDEFVGVRDYVRKLQGERAGQIAGRELEPWMAEAPEMGVTQQELGEQVVSTLRQSELDRPGGSIWTRLAEKYEF